MADLFADYFSSGRENIGKDVPKNRCNNEFVEIECENSLFWKTTDELEINEILKMISATRR